MTRQIINRTIRQSIPILIIAMLLGILAGQILNLSGSVILLPWVLFIIPIVNGIGGNLGTVIGARLSSALHMGTLSTQLYGKPLEENIMTGLLLGIITYLSLALFSLVLSPILGLEMTVDPMRFGIIIALTGIMLTFVVLAISMIAALYTFKFGLDPDNFVAPLTTSSGDIFGILCLILTLNLVGI